MDRSGRLRHGWKASIEIPSRHPDERAALYVLASLQHRHGNAFTHELVCRHRACRATAYDNHAAIVTHEDHSSYYLSRVAARRRGGFNIGRNGKRSGARRRQIGGLRI